MTSFRVKPVMLALAFCFVLAGCGDGGIQDVKQWMDETRANSKVEVPKVSEPKKFTPFNYAGKNSIDPYDPTKLAVALAKFKASTTGSSGIKPNLDRRREPLESYPLDAIRMVGTLQKPGLTYAILQVDKAIFQAKVGNYVGQNMGLITRISDEKVELKEIVQDASGEWVERKAILELQEVKK